MNSAINILIAYKVNQICHIFNSCMRNLVPLCQGSKLPAEVEAKKEVYAKNQQYFHTKEIIQMALKICKILGLE